MKWIDEGREREMEELMERENFRERERNGASGNGDKRLLGFVKVPPFLSPILVSRLSVLHVICT